jgi:hypothetical protein
LPLFWLLLPLLRLRQPLLLWLLRLRQPLLLRLLWGA